MTKPLHTISSTASMKVFGTTGPVDTGGASFYNKTASSSEAGSFGAPSSVGGWKSLSTTKTASFTAIQDEVVGEVIGAPYENSLSSSFGGPRRSSEREDQLDDSHNATGQLKPGSPVGDMLLPLLAMAMIYFFVKLFRNRKTSHTL